SNEWFSRRARIELTTRAEDGRGIGNAAMQLRELFDKQTNVVVKLRALWTLYAVGAADEQFLHAQLRNSDEHVRTWAVRLLTENWPLDTVLSQRPVSADNDQRTKNNEQSVLSDFSRLAREDSSGLVRLALASTLQRMGISNRVELAAGLVSHKDDAADHNLPSLVWYGLIPVAET